MQMLCTMLSLGQLYYLHPENAVTAGSWNSGNFMEESETQQRNPPGMTDDLVSLVLLCRYSTLKILGFLAILN